MGGVHGMVVPTAEAIQYLKRVLQDVLCLFPGRCVGRPLHSLYTPSQPCHLPDDAMCLVEIKLVSELSGPCNVPTCCLFNHVCWASAGTSDWDTVRINVEMEGIQGRE